MSRGTIPQDARHIPWERARSWNRSLNGTRPSNKAKLISNKPFILRRLSELPELRLNDSRHPHVYQLLLFLPQGKSTVKEYVNAINPDNLTCLWDPQGTWNEAYGDSKATTKRRFRLETMLGTDGKYHVRVLGGEGIPEFTIPGAGPPDSKTVISQLRADLP
ncbi:hypothetical protein NA57DRAFT_80244 [Rhizodiscina lignyota]|uniref:Uncharacterized protein n=1 Tax=Rhizodiscina lignyota TaxID=1504668 RepID=A0A9P4M2E1_9PEZI|nr:hypothetical protein NA57DRAFT_80244 [Rhizodiscina lignyota]